MWTQLIDNCLYTFTAIKMSKIYAAICELLSTSLFLEITRKIEREERTENEKIKPVEQTIWNAAAFQEKHSQSSARISFVGSQKKRREIPTSQITRSVLPTMFLFLTPYLYLIPFRLPLWFDWECITGLFPKDFFWCVCYLASLPITISLFVHHSGFGVYPLYSLVGFFFNPDCNILCTSTLLVLRLHCDRVFSCRLFFSLFNRCHIFGIAQR